MSRLLLERLRSALARQYDVERELGVGGMGAVYVARDLALERRVAIKVLLPEHASATAAERFLREARILARLSHPNVVPVHSAGEADGLFYYVMDYVEGETLAERLARGPLSEDEVLKLGDDLLAALEAAHESGIVHRDIKPGNIFLPGDRALLGDFGIAKAMDEQSPPLTAPGRQVGTPAYMAPEQVSGGSTPRTDLYAVGMVLYEAMTGERWVIGSVDEADWSKVSPELARVLRRALAWSPGQRFQDAASFRRALARPAARRSSVARAAKTLAGSVVIAALFLLGRELLERRPAGAEVNELAILPVQVMGVDSARLDGEGLAALVTRKLERMGVAVVTPRRAFSWWDSAYGAGQSAAPERAAAAALGARRAAFATLETSDGRIWAELDLFDARGEPLPGQRQIEIGRADVREVADSLTLRLAQIVLGGDLAGGVPELTRDPDALIQFVQGEKAFEHGQWDRALEFYQVAVARDSSFMLAWWHMANAWRFLGQRGPYPADFRSLFDRYGAGLSRVDSLLLAAQLARAGPERIARYREIHRRYPVNDFAAFLYGEELFNRGPLWGVPLDSAAAVLETAAALSPTWASALFHLFWADVRLGRAADARRALDGLMQTAETDEEGWFLDPLLLDLAFNLHFRPESAADELRRRLDDPRFDSPTDLPVLVRLAGAFDLPDVEVTLGRLLASKTTWPSSHRAAGHLAMGLGLMTLGRVEAAWASFDSAAALHGGPSARLLAAEWRVVPGAVSRALELPWRDGRQEREGREQLEALLGRDSLGVRAAWALALDAYARGELERARQLAGRVEGSRGDMAGPLGILLAAMDSAAQRHFRAALAVSEPLLEKQAWTVPLAGGEAPGTLGDPFARALLHLLRGSWLEQVGEGEGARREWLWYQAVDIDGLPGLELPQAGEIDWALGNYGRYLRGISALSAGDTELACRTLRRAAELWAETDARLAELARRTREGARQACP